MHQTIIPAQPGFHAKLTAEEGIAYLEPIIAWLFDPSVTRNNRPIPLTPAGRLTVGYSILGPDGEEVYAG